MRCHQHDRAGRQRNDSSHGFYQILVEIENQRLRCRPRKLLRSKMVSLNIEAQYGDATCAPSAKGWRSNAPQSPWKTVSARARFYCHHRASRYLGGDWPGLSSSKGARGQDHVRGNVDVARCHPRASDRRSRGRQHESVGRDHARGGQRVAQAGHLDPFDQLQIA